MTVNKTALDELRIDRSAAPARRGGFPTALVLVLIVLFAAAGAGVWWMNRPPAIVVRTGVVREVSSAAGERTLLNGSGYVTARREATVSAKITGKVVEVLVEEGMNVQTGQVLARLDSSNVETNCKLAQAQLVSAKKALLETQANLERANQELARRKAAGNAISALDLERAEAEAKALQAHLERETADVDVAEQECAVWKQQLEDTVITAPFAGIVTSKDSQPGEMISPISAGGGFTRTGICTIVDMSSLEIDVDVSESYINRVERGQPVLATLDAYPDWRIPAKVIAIIPSADRQKATVKVRVGFEKLDPRILPDMSVKVAFLSAGDSNQIARTVLVPKGAVRQVDGKDVVWVVQNGQAERRAVNVGTATGDDVAIAAGVNSGERVVIEGADKLADGARVTEVQQ